MRPSLRIVSAHGGFTIRFREPQRQLFLSALEYMTSREEGDLVTRVATGTDKENLELLWRRTVGAEEVEFSREELHVLFCVLFSWECYFPSSEEDFYRRTGFFRENARDVAASLLQQMRELGGEA